MNNIPLRKCLLNNVMLPKNELFRIIKTPEGIIKIDTTGKANGRGAYLKKDLDTINSAKKKHILDRAFDVKVDDSIYEDLIKLL
jgi:predicted RNA-binding protein YlxR (DUF448 family)